MGLLDAAVGLIGQGVGAISTGKQNRKTRKFNEHMYDRQVADTFTMWRAQNEYDETKWNKENEYFEGLWNKQNKYNEDMWRMMNEYNDPTSQMQRFSDAGLNPNLIYGQSNMGGNISTAEQETGKLESGNLGGAPPATPYNPKYLDLNPASGIAAGLAMEQTRAQTNNLETMNNNLKLDADLKVAEAAGKNLSNDRAKIDLHYANENAQTQQDAMKLANAKIQQEMKLGLRADERAAVLNASTVREAAQRVLNLRGQQMTNEIDQKIKTVELQIKKGELIWQKVNPVRIIPQLLEPVVNDLHEARDFMYQFDPTDKKTWRKGK